VILSSIQNTVRISQQITLLILQTHTHKITITMPTFLPLLHTHSSQTYRLTTTPASSTLSD